MDGWAPEHADPPCFLPPQHTLALPQRLLCVSVLKRGQFGADVADLSFKTWKGNNSLHKLLVYRACLSTFLSPSIVGVVARALGHWHGASPGGHLPWVSAASYLDRCSWVHCKSVPGGLLVSYRSCLGLGTERRGVLPSGWSPLGTCAHDFSPDSVGGILDEAPASSPHTPLSPLWALAMQELWASGTRAGLSKKKPACLTLGGVGECGCLCPWLVSRSPPSPTSFSLELAGGGDPAFPQPEDNQPCAGQLLRLQREEEAEPVPALHLPACQR